VTAFGSFSLPVSCLILATPHLFWHHNLLHFGFLSAFHFLYPRGCGLSVLVLWRAFWPTAGDKLPTVSIWPSGDNPLVCDTIALTGE
jgi:hypothetical protein